MVLQIRSIRGIGMGAAFAGHGQSVFSLYRGQK